MNQLSNSTTEKEERELHFFHFISPRGRAGAQWAVVALDVFRLVQAALQSIYMTSI